MDSGAQPTETFIPTSESSNASTSRQWRDAAMQFRYGPKFPLRPAEKSENVWEHAGGQYHGSHPDDEYPALRHVPVSRQSARRRRDRCRPGGTDADAVHSSHCVPLGSRIRHENARQFPGPEQYVAMRVQLGGGNLDNESWTNHGDDSVISKAFGAQTNFV